MEVLFVDMKDWEILKTLHQEKSTVRVAESLYISQSSVVYRLNRMEEEMESRLFERGYKGITLTDTGMHLLSFCDRAQQLSAQIRESVKLYGKSIGGTIKVGSSATFMSTFLPAQLQVFHQKYPRVTVTLVTALNNKLLEMLNSGALEVAIVRGDHPWDGYAFHLYDDPLVIVSTQPITMQVLQTTPFITYTGDPTLRRQIERWFEATFQEPPVTTTDASHVQGTQICIQLVKAGLGWSVVPLTRTLDVQNLYSQAIFSPSGEPLVRITRLLYTEQAKKIDAYSVFVDNFCEFYSTFEFPPYAF